MGETNETAGTITRTAQYSCQYRVRGDSGETFRGEPVTIKVIPGEGPKKTEDRFEIAARAKLPSVSNMMNGCHSHRFVGFLPTAGQVLARMSETRICDETGWGRQICQGVTEKKPEPRPLDKCAGEWAIRPVCYR